MQAQFYSAGRWDGPHLMIIYQCSGSSSDWGRAQGSLIAGQRGKGNLYQGLEACHEKYSNVTKKWNLVSFDKILTDKSKKICLLVVLILACLVHPISYPRCIKQCINKPIKSWWIHLLSNCKEVADRLFALKGTNSKISKKFPISDVVIQKLQQVHD